MKKTFKTIVALTCAALICSCAGKTNASAEAIPVDEILSTEGTEMDSLSYCLGVNMGMGIKYQLASTPFDVQNVKEGFVAGYNQISRQTHEEAIEILRKFFSQEFGQKQAEYQEALQADSTAVFNPFESAEQCNSVSYAFGNDLGCNLKRAKLPIHLGWLWNGFQGGWDGTAIMGEQEIMKFLNNYFMNVLPAQNEARSKAWIEAKAQEAGVQVTESGLAYKVIEAGDMSKAARNDEDIVKVHYVGRLQDGTVFDASRFASRSAEQQKMMRMYQPTNFDENGNFIGEDEPVEFPLNRVIKGWTEGMKLVGPGGKIMLYIPADLAYGRSGAGNGQIGANEALEFEVELIEVTPAGVEVE